MCLTQKLKAMGGESGQVLIFFGLLLPLLILFVGFAIDFGFAFVTRAELSKAADAAALAAMRNLAQGQTTATSIAKAEFALNYNASSKLNATNPSMSVSYSTASNGEPIINVTDTATINTAFIKLAGFNTLTIGSSSQATRPPILLSLVLDTSGSMNLNGGGAALPGSVDSFLDYFINGTDELGEVSFSSIASNNVAMSTNFKTAITTSVAGLSYAGATYAQGGLLDGQTQVQGIASPPANAVKVVVFFTDGWANTNQDKLGGSLVNYGGCSPVEETLGWCSNFFCLSPTTGATQSYTSPNSGSCNGASTFKPQDTADLGNSASLNVTNVSTDAKYRAVQLANTMRTQGITVYAIGLGNEIDETNLEEIANDPASPQYNSSEPSGLAEFAPTASDLDNAFQTVASKILLRLTQ